MYFVTANAALGIHHPLMSTSLSSDALNKKHFICALIDLITRRYFTFLSAPALLVLIHVQKASNVEGECREVCFQHKGIKCIGAAGV